MKQVSRVETRRETARMSAKKVLEQISSGEIEVYVGYRRLYAYWCSNNAALQELRPMFRIPNIEPDGWISVTEDFEKKVVFLAREISERFST